MTLLTARNLSLSDIHRLLGFQPLYNGSFAPLLSLELLTANESHELALIQEEFRNYWVEDKVLEGQVRLIALAPLLRLAGFNRPPIKLKVEQDIARIYVEDEDVLITGRFDIVAVNKEQSTGNNTSLWILVVESKESKVDATSGLAQLLAYAFKSLEHQESVWGLATNGLLYQFVQMRQGNPPTYQYMPVLNFFETQASIQLLQVLKAICKL